MTYLGVAQSGRVPVLETGGRRFKSSHPDQFMSCALCEKCREAPGNPGSCIYGGPYSGLISAEAYYAKVLPAYYETYYWKDDRWS